MEQAQCEIAVAVVFRFGAQMAGAAEPGAAGIGVVGELGECFPQAGEGFPEQGGELGLAGGQVGGDVLALLAGG